MAATSESIAAERASSLRSAQEVLPVLLRNLNTSISLYKQSPSEMKRRLLDELNQIQAIIGQGNTAGGNYSLDSYANVNEARQLLGLTSGTIPGVDQELGRGGAPAPTGQPYDVRTNQTFSPPFARPAGLSDADWNATVRAYQQGTSGTTQNQVPLSRPTGLSDQDWAATVAAYNQGTQITPQSIEQGIKSNITGYGASSYTGPSIVDYLNSLGKASDFTSRSTLAKQFGIQNYTGTAAQNTQLLSTLRNMGPATVNTTPSGMTASGLTSRASNPINLGIGASSYSAANSLVAGADATSKSIQDYINLLTPPVDANKQRYNDLLRQVEGMLPDQGGRGAAQLAAEQAGGVPQLKQQLADINAQILSKTASYKAAQAQYDILNQEIEGKPITMSSIIGAQAQVNKMALARQKADAADIGLLQATAQGLQGQLTAAQDTANRAVDLKYQDTQDAINLRLQQLQLIQGELTKSEKIRADAIEMYLKDQQQKLAVQIANQKDQNATLLNLLQTYPDAKIQLTDTLEQAAAKVSSSRIYQDKIRPPVSATTSTTPISTVDAKRIKDLYGFTPPIGATMAQIQQFIADNPGATPEELQQGVDQLNSKNSQTQFLTEEYFTKRAGGVSAFSKDLMAKVKTARAAGYSDQEIIDFLF